MKTSNYNLLEIIDDLNQKQMFDLIRTIPAGHDTAEAWGLNYDGDIWGAKGELENIFNTFSDEEKRAYLLKHNLIHPEVGDLATMSLYTDTIGYDVIKVTPKSVTLRQRKEILVEEGVAHPGGFAAHWSKMPKYETVSDPDGAIKKATLRGNGKWKSAGHPTRSPGMNVYFGYASYHYDCNF